MTVGSSYKIDPSQSPQLRSEKLSLEKSLLQNRRMRRKAHRPFERPGEMLHQEQGQGDSELRGFRNLRNPSEECFSA